MNHYKNSFSLSLAFLMVMAILSKGVAQASEPVVITPETDRMMSAATLQAKAITDAMNSKDYATIADSTLPSVISKMGGRDDAIAGIKHALEDSKLPMKSATVSNATELVDTGETVYAVVPESVSIVTPGGIAKSESFLLGVSDDRGKTYKFIDGAAGETMIREILPKLPPTVKLTKRKTIAPQRLTRISQIPRQQACPQN